VLKICEFAMRVTALLSLAVLTAAATSAAAVTEDRKIACRDYASAVADEWAAGDIYRAKADEEPEAKEVLVIAGGVKYFVPRTGQGVIRPVGERIYHRKQVYLEEFRRCLRNPDFGLTSANDEPGTKVE
jgi:hypothetical protein